MGRSYSFAVLMCVAFAASALADCSSYQFNILRLDRQQPAICSGALVSDNIVLTSAQCVHNVQPNAIRLMPIGNATALNVTRIHWDPLANATTLFPDVALLQLQNGTRLPTNMHPIPIDWTAQQWSECTVYYGHNRTDRVPSVQRIVDVHVPCERFNGRNLTTCTNYTFTDYSQCLGNYAEEIIDHGTPLVCRGQLTGILSNVVKQSAQANVPCALNATAYFSRFEARVSEWLKRTLNANKAQPATPVSDVHVTHWSPTGSIARPTSVHANAPATVDDQQHNHVHAMQHPSPTLQQHSNAMPTPANGKHGKRNAAGASTSASAFGVIFGLIVFTVLNAQ